MLNKELLNRFMSVDPATMGHYINAGFMDPAIRPLWSKEFKVIGEAVTVKIPGRDSTAIYYAISKAPEGSILVVDRCGDTKFACCGEMVATYAQGRKLAGIIVDGPITDSTALQELDIPIFATGVSPVTTMLLGVTGEYNVPIVCGGATVQPGDLVFANNDGVLVFPPDNYEDALAKAEESVEKEVEQRKIFAKGELPGWDIEKLFETDTVTEILKLRDK